MKSKFLSDLLDTLNNEIKSYEFLLNREQTKEDKAFFEGRIKEATFIRDKVRVEIYGK